MLILPNVYPHNKRLNILCLLFSFILTGLVLNVNAGIFETAKLHEIRISTNRSDWFSKLENYYENAQDGEKHKFLSVNVSLDNVVFQNVGLRFKGQYSYSGFSGKKKPFRLDFDSFTEGQLFEGLEKLNLHNLAGDPSFLREYISYGLFAHVGIAAPRTSFCRLYINETYWGCYLIVEEPDKYFLKNHFVDSKGGLFEAIEGTDLKWKGNNPASYTELELKSGSVQSWNSLINWIDVLNNYSGYDFQQQFSSLFNTDDFLKTFAIDVLINNRDSYYGSGRNFLIYDNLISQHLQWIPWDYNLSFWAVDQPLFPSSFISGNYRPMVQRIIENPELRQRYLSGFCKLIDVELADFKIDERIQKAVALIAAAVEEDSLKFYSTADFYTNTQTEVSEVMLRNGELTQVRLPGISTLFKKRINSIRESLFAEGAQCEELSKIPQISFLVFPNPSTGDFSIYTENEVTESAFISLYDYSGKLLSQKRFFPLKGTSNYSFPELNPGIYLLKLTDDNNSFTQKIILN